MACNALGGKQLIRISHLASSPAENRHPVASHTTVANAPPLAHGDEGNSGLGSLQVPQEAKDATCLAQGAENHIWVAQDALKLAAQAVSMQLFSVTELPVSAQSATDQSRLAEELAYQTRLVCSVLDLFGLNHFRAAGQLVLQELDVLGMRIEQSCSDQLDLIQRWQTAVLGFLHEPEERAAQELLVDALVDIAWLRPLDDRLAEDMLATLERVALDDSRRLQA